MYSVVLGGISTFARLSGLRISFGIRCHCLSCWLGFRGSLAGEFVGFYRGESGRDMLKSGKSAFAIFSDGLHPVSSARPLKMFVAKFINFHFKGYGGGGWCVFVENIGDLGVTWVWGILGEYTRVAWVFGKGRLCISYRC